MNGNPNPYNYNHYWGYSTVIAILRNEAYIGNMVQNKCGSLSYKNKKSVKKPKDEWIRVIGTHEPIISLEVWERVRSLDDSPARPKRTSDGEISLFAGYLFCMDCGFAMCIKQERRESKRLGLLVYGSYLCGSYSRSGKMACTTHTINKNRLEDIVIADIKQKAVMVVNDEQGIVERVGNINAGESSKQLTSLKTAKRTAVKRQTELEHLIESLYIDKVKGKITEDVCARLINQYEAERHGKTAEIQTVHEQIENFQTVQSNTVEWVDTIRHYNEIGALDRNILAKLIDKIEIGDRKVIDGQIQQEVCIYYKFIGHIG